MTTQGRADPSRRVVIALVTYNSESLLADFISSLDEGFGDVPYDLIVADNDSHDNTVAYLRRCAPWAKIVEMGRNAGYSAGINAAVAHADSYSAILVVNPDVRLGKNCIGELHKALNLPGTGIAVPRLADRYGRLSMSMRREPTVARAFGDALIGARRAGKYVRWGEIVNDPGAYDEETCTDWAEGSTQLISKECWSHCGTWDESFFLYSEETEYNLRARDAGFCTRLVPSAEAVHLKGESSTSPQLWALLTVNRIRLFYRRNGLLRALPYWFAFVLRETSRSLIGSKTNRAALLALFNPAAFRRTNLRNMAK